VPPNHFESEVESFLEGSHGDRTHIKQADHPRLHHYAGRYSTTPQKPQDFNVSISKIEKPTGELHAKFRGHTQPPRVSIRVMQGSVSETVHHCRALH